MSRKNEQVVNTGTVKVLVTSEVGMVFLDFWETAGRRLGVIEMIEDKGKGLVQVVWHEDAPGERGGGKRMVLFRLKVRR